MPVFLIIVTDKMLNVCHCLDYLCPYQAIVMCLSKGSLSSVTIHSLFLFFLNVSSSAKVKCHLKMPTTMNPYAKRCLMFSEEKNLFKP